MAKLLYQPLEERIKKTNMYRFMEFINERFGKDFKEYEPLHRWSIDNIAEFWSAFWDFADIIYSRGYDQVIDDAGKMPGAHWFSGAELNFAENLLRFRDERVALIFKGEGQPSTRLTYAQLYDEVARVARALKDAGIEPGDRVVGFMPKMPEAIIAMLAATSLGASWSSCSPDFGIKGVLDRFGQIKPRVLFTANGYSMPIYFWDDADGSKYYRAYFDVYPNVWRHGDFVTVTGRGGVVMHGRSDATLNPGGVRIGTAEIYRQLEQMGEIDDSVVVGQDWKNDVRVILFVKLAEGIELTEQLKKKIKDTIRTNASPRHVPAKIISVPDVPYTLNMKKVELAVKKVIQGQQVLNKDALSNPQALDYYADIKELKS